MFVVSFRELVITWERTVDYIYAGNAPAWRWVKNSFRDHSSMIIKRVNIPNLAICVGTCPQSGSDIVPIATVATQTKEEVDQWVPVQWGVRGSD